MVKVKKILLIVLIVIAVLIGLVVFITSIFGEGLIKAAVQTGATKTLGVGVTLKSVNLSILGGSVGLKGFVIDNPPGYQNKTLLELGEAKVAVDIGTLTKDTIHIKNVLLDGTVVTIEEKGMTNNLKELLNKLQSGEKKEPAPQPQPGAKEAKPAKKMQIDELVISNTTVKVKLLPIPGKSDTATIKLDTIKMNNLGGDKKLEVGQLSEIVLTAIGKGVAGQMANLGTDLGKGAIEEGKSAAGGVVEGIKGLFGGKKTDPNKK
jgi:hypothetical protein